MEFEPQKDIQNTWTQKLEGNATIRREKFLEREITVIGSEHGSKKAATLIEKLVSSEIKDPGNWLFAVEGAGYFNPIEAKTAREIAEKNNIPFVDPIMNPFNADILKLLKGSKLGEELDQQLALGQIARYIEKDFDITETMMATILGIPEKELSEAKQNALEDENIEDRGDHEKELAQLISDLSLISNAVSVQVLEYYLQKYPERKQVLLSVGEKHTQMFNTPNLIEYLKVRLSKEEIEKILSARNDRYAAQIRQKADSSLENL